MHRGLLCGLSLGYPDEDGYDAIATGNNLESLFTHLDPRGQEVMV
ncbi:MAG: hypothetical protein AAFY20_24555 [Cyanobacteria bacterium J06639_14]